MALEGAEGSAMSGYCYEFSREILGDPDDEEESGAPYCDGRCERCDKSWGDEDV